MKLTKAMFSWKIKNSHDFKASPESPRSTLAKAEKFFRNPNNILDKFYNKDREGLYAKKPFAEIAFGQHLVKWDSQTPYPHADALNKLAEAAGQVSLESQEVLFQMLYGMRPELFPVNVATTSILALANLGVMGNEERLLQRSIFPLLPRAYNPQQGDFMAMQATEHALPPRSKKALPTIGKALDQILITNARETAEGYVTCVISYFKSNLQTLERIMALKEGTHIADVPGHESLPEPFAAAIFHLAGINGLKAGNEWNSFETQSAWVRQSDIMTHAKQTYGIEKI